MGFSFLPSLEGQDDSKKGSRKWLRWSALFLGELRDGLTMINMQAAFLIVSKGYSEKQAGLLFFVFGMSQFLFQTPAGYLYDYTEKKILWLSIAAIATTLLTVFTAIFAEPQGGNLTLMVIIKFVQGGVTSFIPPGLNSITQGIVGAVGMTTQVAANEMMNHLGTSIIVLGGALLGVALYPNLGMLFIVSPIFCISFILCLKMINADDIDHDEARGLTSKAKTDGEPNSSNYTPPETVKKINESPSFNLGWGSTTTKSEAASEHVQSHSPLKVIRDPILLTFICIVFLFHVANGTILPLVMQTLAIGNGRIGILMSGLCIIVAQLSMVVCAKICGDYSGKYGRKKIFLLGLFTVPIRCLILTILLQIRGDGLGSALMQFFILSTQLLDGVGAGVFGTMYILVTSDISGGTGRFSMTLGLTTAAMSIGGTVSGYLGEALAEDLGYQEAFCILMFASLVPAVLYLLFMPETLASMADTGVTTLQNIKEEAPNEDGGETMPPGKYQELV